VRHPWDTYPVWMSELYIPRRRTCHSEAEGPVTGELLGFPGTSEKFCMPDPYRLWE